VFLVIVAIFLSVGIRLDFAFSGMFLSSIYQLSFLIPVVTIFFMSIFNQYFSILRFVSIDEFIKITVANICSVLFVLLVNIAFFQINIFRSFYIIYFILAVGLLCGYRVSIRVFERLRLSYLRLALTGKNVLIIGAGEAGASIIETLSNRKHLQKVPVGVLDDDRDKFFKSIHGVPIIGSISEVVQISEKYKVNEIIIAIPSLKKSRLKEIVELCKKTNCEIKTTPRLTDIVDGNIDVNQIRDVKIDDLLGRDPVSIDLSSISSYLREKVIIVTGSGGSIGSELCRQVMGFNPSQLLLFDNYENGVYDLQQELYRKLGKEAPIQVIIGSVRDKNRMHQVFTKYRPQIVFHAAAHKHVPLLEDNPFEAVKNNVFGTLNCVELADEFNVERFVLISSDKAVNPSNVMGATKRICEIICQEMNKESKTLFASVRFGNVLGSNGSVIPLFKKQLDEGGPLTVTHPDIIRYFMTPDEAIQLILQAGAFGNGGEIFVLDMGEPVKIDDLARDFIELSGLVVGEDVNIVYTGLRPGEKMYEELLMEEEGLSNTVHEKIFIGNPITVDKEMFFQELERLQEITEKEDLVGLKAVLNRLVPTYRN